MLLTESVAWMVNVENPLPVGVPPITPVLATMLGLGIGIDYALFIVTRFRQALHDGRTPEDAAKG